ATSAWIWGRYLRSLRWRRHPLAWAFFLCLFTAFPIFEVVVSVLPEPSSRGAVWRVLQALILTIQGALWASRLLRKRPPSPYAASEEDIRLLLTAVGVLGAVFVAILVLVGVLAWRHYVTDGAKFS